MSAAATHGHAPAVSKVDVPPFSGGGKWLTLGGGVGLLLLILTFVGAAGNPQVAYFSYLTAFTYWAGISMSSVILLMIFHATHARWMTIIRRPIEAMAVSVPIFLVLFIPVILGMKHIYVWVEPPESLGHEALKLIAGKAAYLNVKGFVVRGFFYLVLATFLGQRLYGWSLRQDRGGDPIRLLQSQRNLSAGGLPFIALALTFAAFDWLMSLNPTWFSTIFGVYYFAGSFVSSLSLLAIATAAGAADRHVRRHDVGRAHAQHREADAGVRLLLDVHRVLAAAADLDRRASPMRRLSSSAASRRGGRRLGFLLIVGHFFLPVRRAAVAFAEARPEAAAPGRLLDSVHPLGRRVLARHAEPEPRGLCVALDRHHGVPGRWPGRGRLQRSRGCAASSRCR